MRDEALKLISDLRIHLLDSPLASSSDADYFRALYKKKSPEPVLFLPAPTPLLPPPLPAPIPPPRLESPPPAPPKVEALPIREKKENSSLFTLFGTIAPNYPLLKEIPSDEKAKKVANRWKTKNQSAPISILSFGEPLEHQKLLYQIALALDVHFGSARKIVVDTIEKEKQWEAFLSAAELKLILCCDYTLWQLGDLMRHFKETPAQGKRLLGKVPLFLLPDLTLYLKDPLLKRSLWKALCQTIASL